MLLQVNTEPDEDMVSGRPRFSIHSPVPDFKSVGETAESEVREDELGLSPQEVQLFQVKQIWIVNCFQSQGPHVTHKPCRDIKHKRSRMADVFVCTSTQFNCFLRESQTQLLADKCPVSNVMSSV